MTEWGRVHPERALRPSRDADGLQLYLRALEFILTEGQASCASHFVQDADLVTAEAGVPNPATVAFTKGTCHSIITLFAQLI